MPSIAFLLILLFLTLLGCTSSSSDVVDVANVNAVVSPDTPSSSSAILETCISTENSLCSPKFHNCLCWHYINSAPTDTLTVKVGLRVLPDNFCGTDTVLWTTPECPSYDSAFTTVERHIMHTTAHAIQAALGHTVTITFGPPYSSHLIVTPLYPSDFHTVASIPTVLWLVPQWVASFSIPPHTGIYSTPQ